MESALDQAWLAVLRRVSARDRANASCTCRAALIAARRIALLDVSGGRETLPVLVSASADDAELLRRSVHYLKECFAPGGDLPLRQGGCASVCKEGACLRDTCPCGKRPDGVPALAADGRLRPRSQNDISGGGGSSSTQVEFPLTECGPACSCAGDCAIRVTQQPVSVPLTVVPAGECGWGVVTDEALPSGTFVAVYAGEVGATELLRGLALSQCYTFALV